MPITPLPALDRTSVNFKANVDTFFGSQLPTFSTEAEAARVEINAKEASATASAATATTKAGEALTSANNAATSKTDADTARDAAVVARTAAEAALDSFDDRYLGAKATAPTLDNDGAALLTGALYWDTSLPGMRSWNGTAWVTLPAATAAAIANTPAGGVTEATVQGAIDGLEARKAKAGANSDITDLTGLTAPIGTRLLSTQTVSSPVASVDFTSLPSGYDAFILEIVDYVPATTGTELWLRISQAAAFVTAANYGYGWAFANNTTADYGAGSLVDTKLMLANGISNGSGEGISGRFQIWGVAGTTNVKRSVWDLEGRNNTSVARYYGGGAFLGNLTAVDGLRILSSSGNISSGTFKLYGVR